MDTHLYLAFLLLSTGLILVPGPNVLVIVSTSLTQGGLRGLQTVAGTSSAMAIQLLVAALGTGWLVAQFSRGLEILRWLGVAYLLYLGLRQLYRLLGKQPVQHPASTVACFSRGFLVSLTNPKTILFFAAFLPQFVTPGLDYLYQIGVLSLSFLLLATLLDSGYALLAARLQPLLSHHGRLGRGLGAGLYLGAGIWLALRGRWV